MVQGTLVSDKGDWRAMVGHDCDYRFRPNFWADALRCEFDEASGWESAKSNSTTAVHKRTEGKIRVSIEVITLGKV